MPGKSKHSIAHLSKNCHHFLIYSLLFTLIIHRTKEIGFFSLVCPENQVYSWNRDTLNINDIRLINQISPSNFSSYLTAKCLLSDFSMFVRVKTQSFAFRYLFKFYSSISNYMLPFYSSFLVTSHSTMLISIISILLRKLCFNQVWKFDILSFSRLQTLFLFVLFASVSIIRISIER